MSEIYEIHIGAPLSGTVHRFFEGMEINGQEDGTTVLVGEIIDQADLHGLLAKIRDLGLPLLKVNPRENKN